MPVCPVCNQPAEPWNNKIVSFCERCKKPGCYPGCIGVGRIGGYNYLCYECFQKLQKVEVKKAAKMAEERLCKTPEYQEKKIKEWLDEIEAYLNDNDLQDAIDFLRNNNSPENEKLFSEQMVARFYERACEMMESHAKNLELALRYTDAIILYEFLDKWEDAGRCRKLKSELKTPKTKIDIGTIDQSTNIKDNVISRSTIGGSELQKDPFSICPYCGKDLDLPKTPKYCPYCKERLKKD